MPKFAADANNPAYNTLSKAKRRHTFALMKSSRDADSAREVMAGAYKNVLAAVEKSQLILRDIFTHGPTTDRDLLLRKSLGEFLALEPAMLAATHYYNASMGILNEDIKDGIGFIKADMDRLRQEIADVKKSGLPARVNPQQVTVKQGTVTPYTTTARVKTIDKPQPVSAENPQPKRWATINDTTYEILFCDYSLGDRGDYKKPAGISLTIATDADAMIAALKGKTVNASIVLDPTQPLITGVSLNVAICEKTAPGVWRVGLLGSGTSVRES
ncbi:hypothetical protein ACELLULO517_08115 [Acidisoma cellulosilytica]|uniref:Uncharacterized protein n=1 Tax=Acidisoma cellulosilyticum TaxID=2802395 RepID=A0A963Z1N4_9PROT|nr:hypothetical protein [Acidisoma cellulosilyticum]MCB8880193.1 hypothetical protein [Acidisoma cellulosilyticum]